MVIADMIKSVTVRMYRVGFGDCFLLRFRGDDGDFRVLLDCGTITEGQDQIGRIVESIISDCMDPDGVARIALVVGTHRHRDHVGGFADPRWNAVEVGEVWLPWTEDPADEAATRIRNKQSSLAARLAPRDHETLPLAAAPDTESAPKALARSVHAMALNALTNEKAMATLHGGFKSAVAPKFLPRAEAVFEARTLAGLPGVTIHVLGPPRDEAAIKAMDPPTGKGFFAQPEAEAASGEAFSRHWRIDEAAFRAVAPNSTVTPADLLALQKHASEPSGELAVALDNAVNNTSLVLLFEVGDQFMLFPADAQWGVWNAILQNSVARALLAKTSFYKVGHHGSHNATPKELIESLMQAGFTAFFSTTAMKRWPDIPRPPLLEAVRRKAKRWARSDDENAAAASGFSVEAGLYLECELEVLR